MKKIFIALLLTSALAGCMGYVPGRQSYWDAQVREMCARDGGVKIIEKLPITKTDTAFLGRLDGKLAVPSKASAHPRSPVYSEFSLVTIHSDGNLLVDRAESRIIRRSDGLVVAQWVVYKRSGGDVPTGLVHDSSFTCPDTKTIVTDIQKIFVIEGESK